MLMMSEASSEIQDGKNPTGLVIVNEKVSVSAQSGVCISEKGALTGSYDGIVSTKMVKLYDDWTSFAQAIVEVKH